MNDHGGPLTQPQGKAATLDALWQIDVKRFVLAIARAKAMQAWQLEKVQRWRCPKRQVLTRREQIGVQMSCTN